ncbi:helix-turn-helix transcriptional regulator [Desulfomarina sp.]
MKTITNENFPPVVCVDPVLSKKQVCHLTNIGKSKLAELIKNNHFPKPIVLGPKGSRGIGWRASTINKWLDEQERKEVAQ